MKTCLNILLTVIASLCFQKAHAINPIPQDFEMTTTFSVDDFLQMSYNDFTELSGKKASIGDRIKYLGTKKYLHYLIANNRLEKQEDFANAASSFKWSWGGFLLGLILGVLGVIIVALLFNKPRKNAVISSVIGMLLNGISIGISIG